MTHSATDSTGIAAVNAKTQVLLVGDWQNCEFAASSADIPNACDWPHAANINKAYDLLSYSQQPPELIFLAQPLPGLYCQQEIDRLQQLVPLTRLIIVAGTWCEGELRTGSPPSGVIRLYWYELASWWQAAIRRSDADLCPLWSLPLDNAQAGRWSSANNPSNYLSSYISKTGSLFPVLIDAADYAVYEALSAALGEWGITSCWNSQAASDTLPATAGIWDGGQLSDRELARLTNICHQIDGPVIALLDFPRIEHIQQAQAAGAIAVFAKPYVVEELIAALTTRPTPSAKSRAATPARAPANSESD